ncbi:hypothetical protein T02_807 [Trichinella nativa]|uniref:Uncharacterized protein n=1 Tax=Trichinella nativa TaxID=6335 RepID=A0A0V1KYJ0_9BILA|nr:hypothetical protein T02_807 [Trichinella nativa]
MTPINVLMLGIYLHLYTYPPKVFANYNHYMEFIYEKDSLILNHDIKLTKCFCLLKEARSNAILLRVYILK